jgi:subtilase family serine protease
MKSMKIFALLLAFVLLVGAAGMLPSSVTPKMAPFLVKGPMAVLAQAPAGGGSPIYTCQVGLNPGVVCYDPFQIRHAYAVDQLITVGYTGKGRTIVIIDAFQSPTLIADLDWFDAAYGLPLHGTFLTQIAPDGLTPFVPSDSTMQGWAGEITLDVEWAHAIAPAAHIVLVLAKSSDDADILHATQYAVSHNLGDVISQSFGENESCVDPSILAAEHQLYVNATKKGITIFASSGDDGAAQQTCDTLSWTKAVSSPASDPLVTAVGGTELHAADYCLTVLGCNPATHPLPGTYQGEIGWNEYNQMSSGGGYSVLYGKPVYQGKSVSGKARGVPDISYSAAVYHGVLVRFQGGTWLFGGTSAGSPQWAAIAAIADQKAGKRLGFINGALYHLSQTIRYPNVLHDVIIGYNSVVEPDASNAPVSVPGFSSIPGWDAVTGLGSPNTFQLVNWLIALGPNYSLPPFSMLNPNASGNPTNGTSLVSPH